MITRDVAIDDVASRRIQALIVKILQQCCGQSKVEIELALLGAYCNVADGVCNMPEATRALRAQLVVARGARALVDAIVEIAALDDAQVAMLALTYQDRRMCGRISLSSHES